MLNITYHEGNVDRNHEELLFTYLSLLFFETLNRVRDKKAFFNDQYKERQREREKERERNGMGKTRDLFKKIRDTKGTLHAKMGSIKDRNAMNLTEAEDIKKRWEQYTEELS